MFLLIVISQVKINLCRKAFSVELLLGCAPAIPASKLAEELSVLKNHAFRRQQVRQGCHSENGQGVVYQINLFMFTFQSESLLFHNEMDLKCPLSL